MHFRVTHITDYRYGEPVAEAYLELRLTPPSREMQAVREHRLSIEPASRTSGYRDYFGNEVFFLSLPYRHTRLTIRSEALVQTIPGTLPAESLDLTIQESRQLLTGSLPFVFDYLQPTETVKTVSERSNDLAAGPGSSQQCDLRKLSIQKRSDKFFDGCRIDLA
jgi:transglutaminase-like putative cysteine protease